MHIILFLFMVILVLANILMKNEFVTGIDLGQTVHQSDVDTTRLQLCPNAIY